jgi:3-oxoacyl-[acyl-carrier protein] reductase
MSGKNSGGNGGAMIRELEGETALVIGGTRNIGLATALALKEAGAEVFIVGRADREALAGALAKLGSGPARGKLVDIGDEKAVARLFDALEQELGHASILVNSAGFRPGAPLVQLELEAWRRVVDVMLTGPFLTARELFRRLPEDRRGAIVNIGGLSAHRPVPARAHVIAAKAGLVGLTRALAEEGRGRIRANCVVPGVISTERRPGEPPGRHADQDDYARGACEEVARAVLYFASPADTYVTGQTLHVSGGRFMP